MTKGGDIQPQVYDRHWDSTTNDAVDAVNDLEFRMSRIMDQAALKGVTFLPQHLNFAKLKVINPDAQLMNDGVHAVPAVQYGLATMSYVARTSQAVHMTGVNLDNDQMALFGEQTVRQWATLSETGEPLQEYPE